MTVYEAIQQIINERKAQRRIPHCAELQEVKRLVKLSDDEFKEEVKRLKKDSEISLKIRQTVNSYAFYLE